MTDVGEGYVLQPGEGRLIDLGGFSTSVKASDEETDGMFTLLEADEPPNFGPPLHIHHGIAEAFYVLEGEYITWASPRTSSNPSLMASKNDPAGGCEHIVRSLPTVPPCSRHTVFLPARRRVGPGGEEGPDDQGDPRPSPSRRMPDYRQR